MLKELFNFKLLILSSLTVYGIYSFLTFVLSLIQ